MSEPSDQPDHPQSIEAMFKLRRRSVDETFFYLVMQIVDLKEQLVKLQAENYGLKTSIKSVTRPPSE